MLQSFYIVRMNPRINQLVKSLLQKESLDQCTLPELRQFADRHPFFGAAQLLLTKKMQTESPDQYDEQLQKTFLFFHNPMWVEHMLNDTGIAIITPAQKEEVTEVVTEKEAITAETTESLHNPLEEEITVIATETAPASPVEETTEPAADTSPAIIEIAEEAVAENPATEIKITAEEATTVIESPEEPAPLPEQKEEPVAAPISNITIAPVAKSPAQDFIFEPYHTVDYFASQGIKFKEEEKPKDKFGQQLKSFTEWLKVMKKLPVAEIAKASQPVVEKKVEEMAEHSLEDREVLTEAMAEVWEKQGNRQKAIEIYSKLSLLEPAKSTYFAAKIEDLKKQN